MARSRLFISYRTEDRARVQPLADRLRAAGFDVFFDRYEIAVGDALVEKIEAGSGRGRRRADHAVERLMDPLVSAA